MMETAARTISFGPIPYEEVEAIRKELDEKSIEPMDNYAEALRVAMKEYGTDELGIKEEYWDKLVINKVFAPGGIKWKSVFMEMGNLSSAEWIQRHAINLRDKELRVGNFVPWQARERHSWLQEFAAKKRQSGLKARVIIKNFDYAIHQREKKDGEEAHWELIKASEETPDFNFNRLTGITSEKEVEDTEG